MVKNQNYFVFAVMIAIIVPIVIASLYFINIYNKRDTGQYLSSVQKKAEVLVLGDIELNEIKASPTSRELLVKYTYGENQVNEYSLCLEDIKLDNTLNPKQVKWELYMYDDTSKKYLELSFGNGEKSNLGKLCVSPKIQIGKGETQKFRLDYYYNFDETESNNKSFYAKIILE